MDVQEPVFLANIDHIISIEVEDFRETYQGSYNPPLHY